MQPSGSPPVGWMQRPSVPDVHCTSPAQELCWPPPLMQSPGAAGAVHWLSFGRWLVGTRPPSTPPLDDPELPELDELAPELLPDEPPEPDELPPEPLLEEAPELDELPPELLLEDAPELDELPPSPPVETPVVCPPHAHNAATTTMAPSWRRMSCLRRAA
jgi:hypothetical protein